MPMADALARLASERDTRRTQETKPLPAAPPAEEAAQDHTY
jgi:hypothetical protein